MMIKMKVFTSLLFLFLSTSCSAQVLSRLPKNQIINELSNYIYSNSDYLPANTYTRDEIRKTLRVYGMFHSETDELLVNGLYGFSMSHSHARVYYFIVEDDKYKILDVSSRKNLDASLKELLDFCERQKYCYEITLEYMNRITAAFYRINKNPYNGEDFNCENGVTNKNGLP